MYGTYATILYLQNNTYFQCEILTLLTILYLQYKTCNTYLQWDTYSTNSAILDALHIYKKKKKTATCTTYNTDYIRYKNQKIKGVGKYGKF